MKSLLRSLSVLMLSGVIFSCNSGEEKAAAAAVETEVIPQVRVQQVFERETDYSPQRKGILPWSQDGLLLPHSG